MEQWKPIQEFNGEYEVSNLEWITHQANVQHSFDTGIKQPHRWTSEERRKIGDKVREARLKTPI